MDKLPVTSIIIPVYNEEAVIASCLEALRGLDYPKDRLEIIIVDNNSTDRSREIIERHAFAKYLFEGRKGRSAARNAGIKAASGEILAFIDADCMVSPEWLSNLVAGFVSGSTGCCGGKTVSYYPDNLIERYFDWFFENQPKKITTFAEKYFIGPAFATCNLACRREVFDAIGYFSEEMVAGEDVDAVWRINLKGYQLNYVPSAVVYHKRRSKVSELPEVFFQYLYWQQYLMVKYEDVIGFSYDLKMSIPDIIASLKNIMRCLPHFGGRKKEIAINLMHLLFLFTGIAATIYARIDLKLLKRKKIPGVAFSPNKVVWRWNEDGMAMLMDIEKGCGYELDEVGTRVWQLTQNGLQRHQLAGIIAEEYDVEPAKIAGDIDIIYDDLLKEGLIVQLPA